MAFNGAARLFKRIFAFRHDCQRRYRCYLHQPVYRTAGVNGFVVNGQPLFPILFITIACGAVSGFHSLVSSGTSSKTVSNEKDMLFIGYGSMLIESILAVVSLIVVGAAATGGVMPKGTPFQILPVRWRLYGHVRPFGARCHLRNYHVRIRTCAYHARFRWTYRPYVLPGTFHLRQTGRNERPAESFNQQIFCNRYYPVLRLSALPGRIYERMAAVRCSNQLCAALVFISLSVFLKVTGRQGWMLYVPMGFMFAATMSALAMSIYGIVNKLVTGAPFGMLTDGLQLVVAIALIILALLIATNGLKTLCGSKAGSKNETANA